ncbi:zinc finger BED domain-containing protein 5-like [Centruroides vittatus]|uniref:zinc finger BED domain-containing protein 5-like n=1 Tax=Centruroides vittatus TaxID=120091 RepID=UPI00350FA15E
MSQFLCFVRYECDRDTSIKENVLFCKTVPGHATRQCLFDVFYEATRNYTNIDWTKCIAVCSDDAKAITGKNSGLMKILRDRLIPRAEWTHCFLHRHALVTKNMPENLNQILCEAVKLVNFIKSRPLQNRLFTKLCDEMGENKKSLLFHTEFGLRELKTQLTEYFPKDKNDFSKRWVLNSFSENVVAAAKLPVEIHDQLIEMSADKTLQLQFTSEDLNTFWLVRRHEYGNLVTEALKILIPFATFYL